jgi:hypothetical protein
VRFRYTGADVVTTLEQIADVYGVPCTIRLDNDPEFVSRALDLWAYRKVLSQFLAKGTEMPEWLVGAHAASRSNCSANDS